MKTNYIFDSIEIENIPIISEDNIILNNNEKHIIVQKLLQAYNLAKINVKLGNITGRGFAANICNNQNIWALGTNFNNTRNDISSICAERSAILSLYNLMLCEQMNSNDKVFDFKIKYICMANDSLQTIPIPCEDCMSWLNTNRFFDNKTIIFSIYTENDKLCIKAQNLSKLLPYKGCLTSNVINSKNIKYSDENIKNIISEKNILNLVQKAYDSYSTKNNALVSSQNIAAAILVNNKCFTANKIDWTKRWFVEPLEFAAAKAIDEFGLNIKIDTIAYFGDEYSINKDDKFLDGVVSIKSLGRIRQKHACFSTPLILVLQNSIYVTTIGEYLPHKFEQGYKI